jgi:hypothetical protein
MLKVAANFSEACSAKMKRVSAYFTGATSGMKRSPNTGSL